MMPPRRLYSCLSSTSIMKCASAAKLAAYPKCRAPTRVPLMVLPGVPGDG